MYYFRQVWIFFNWLTRSISGKINVLFTAFTAYIHLHIKVFFSGIPIRLLSSTVNLSTLLTTENTMPFNFMFVATPYLSRVIVHNHVF